jgi:Na+-driven multidrug efflux pump
LIALPAGAPAFLEAVVFEVQSFIISLLNNDVQLAAHSAFQSFSLLFYMFEGAASITCNSFLANAMGKGNVKLA